MVLSAFKFEPYLLVKVHNIVELFCILYHTQYVFIFFFKDFVIKCITLVIIILLEMIRILHANVSHAEF